MKKKTSNLIYPMIILGFALIFLPSCKKDDNNSSDTVTDVDGNVYHTVTIHDQTWMVENIKTTHLNDGTTPIPNVTDPVEWTGKTTLAYCWYNNIESNKDTYGALYNWYAVNNNKLCPKGWHVPSKDEWNTLISNLGGDSTLVGGYLKEAGTAHWIAPNTGADNSSGFTALPGGSCYHSNGSFYYNGKYGWYWSSTATSTTQAWHVYMNYNTKSIFRITGSLKDGFSVRCIKGPPVQ
jgi:uncharacterized protein (TIGR02145 family)